MDRDLLRLATAGSVDDGKSTLIGRLLLDCHAVPEDQLAAAEAASRRRGLAAVDLAFLTDGLRAEREQGITIDVAYRYFSTSRRAFIIADTPGHVQYTRNMVTGASSAELAIILIDVTRGVVTQARRHAFLASLMRIPHVVVAVNKMDLVGYDESAFQAVVRDYTTFAARLSNQSTVFIPISALLGDNVVSRSAAMPWYDGVSLLYHLEHLTVGSARNLVDFRLPVQLSLRQRAGGRLLAGQIVSGGIRAGEEVVVLPSGARTRVTRLTMFHATLDEAVAGDSVLMEVADELDIGRGDMVVRPQNLPLISPEFEATLCWLDDDALDTETTYLLQHTTRRTAARVTNVTYRINPDSLHREPGGALGLNEIGRVRLACSEPLFFDPAPVNRLTSGFILIDPSSNRTVAAGTIKEAVRRLALRTDEPSRPRSSNVVWETPAISRSEREQAQGHGAAVVWLTGLSGSGKTTIARLLERELVAEGARTFLLDGDNIRHGLNGDLGFSAEDRAENVRRVAEVARLAFEHGAIVLAAFIAPSARERSFARSLIPSDRFVEVYVKCSVDTCAARDPKGLYAKALRGDIPEFTGVSSPYEEPQQPEVTIDTETTAPQAAAAAILDQLAARHVLLRT